MTKKLPQSLLLTGVSGVGLTTIGKYIAQLCEIKPTIILPEKDEKIDIDKGIINIDIMRRLNDEMRTKTNKKRIIMIDYAERMTHQAQNSFLKLLEEPNENIHFILISNTTTKLLPTILSRVEKLVIKPITKSQSEVLLDELNITEKTKRSQLLFIASGLPAELTRLASDDVYFTKRGATVRDARELLRGGTYQKLLIAHRYKDDRAAALILLMDAANILKLSISEHPKIDAVNRLNSILETYQSIEANGNIRICLARLVL
jgi:DNA polymerase-3 subunit delta'